MLDVFYWLIIEILESNNLGEVDPKIVDLAGITARQPTDKISIFKTFYVPIKHFMSKSTVFLSNMVYFSPKKINRLQDKDILKTETPLGR